MTETSAAAATTATVSSSSSASSSKTTTTLRALGFCGADDSVHPNMLVMIAQAYPIVEFGVLFRPDKEGQPRYATTSWVESLAAAVQAANQHNTTTNNSCCQPSRMKLAAHFCGTRVNDVLQGNGDFIQQIVEEWGFGRIQINATAVNGVDTSRLGAQQVISNVVALARRFSQVEFIIQKNDETRPLWQGLLEYNKNHHHDQEEVDDALAEVTSSSSMMPKNISMLVDESKGTGQAAKSWPIPPPLSSSSSSPCYEIGYAGGIGPHNIQTVLQDVIQAGAGRAIWIDMESSLRSIKDGRDVFDLDKCYTVIDAVCKEGLTSHPPYLLNVGENN